MFLHGFLESSNMWRSLPLIDLEVHCLFIDLPGHGNSKFSETESPEGGMQQMAIKVIEVIESQGIEDFDILGHSMGGYVAQEVKRLKSQCGKVVLLNSNFWTDSPTKVIDRKRVATLVQKTKTFFLKNAIPGLFANPDKFKVEISELIAEAGEIDSSAIAYASLAMASRRDFSKLMPLEDLFVIHGVADRMVSSEQFKRLGILDGHFFELKYAGHMSHMESPDEVIQALKVILKDFTSNSNSIV